ncbi:MAG: hypothetical protein WD993_07800 [Thermoleophilaceae bacterium]
MPLRRSDSRPWSWDRLGDRTLAVYRSAHDGRERVAALVWQADDPRVTVDGVRPPLLALTMDLEPEPGERNAVAMAGFDSLEAARGHCVEFAGGTTEIAWSSLAETAQIGLYATIRDPGFADAG